MQAHTVKLYIIPSISDFPVNHGAFNVHILELENGHVILFECALI